jgi:hypothetical protein
VVTKAEDKKLRDSALNQGRKGVKQGENQMLVMLVWVMHQVLGRQERVKRGRDAWKPNLEKVRKCSSGRQGREREGNLQRRPVCGAPGLGPPWHTGGWSVKEYSGDNTRQGAGRGS